MSTGTSEESPARALVACNGAERLAQGRFLDALSRTGTAAAACRESGLTRRQVNDMRRRDPPFQAAYDDAMDEAADLLEAEAWRRALEGVPQVLTRAGQTLVIQRYSDPLLVMLLRGCKPAKFHRRTGTAAAASDPDAGIREIATDTDPPRAGSWRC